MSTVFKYPIPINDESEIHMPRGADIICVDVQNGLPHLWARVDPEAPIVVRHFRMAGTGHPLNDDEVGKHIGSVQLRGGTLVFHIFEIRR